MADATFSWDIDPSHASYEVTYQDITNGGSVIAVTPPLITPPNHTALILNLLPNTQYKFGVRANCNPDGVTPWVYNTQTTPNLPSFIINKRAYNPLGNGVPTGAFGGMGLSNSSQSAGTQDVLTANPLIQPNTTTRVALVSDYTDNKFRIGFNINATKCEALFIKKNGTLIHSRFYNYSSIVTTIIVDLTAADIPSTISAGDVFDVLFVINNDLTVAGDPYVPSSGVGRCGTS